MSRTFHLRGLVPLVILPHYLTFQVCSPVTITQGFCGYPFKITTSRYSVLPVSFFFLSFLVNYISMAKPQTQIHEVGKGAQKPHILIIPYPAQGHMLALVDLAHHLSSCYDHLSISVVVTPKNLPLLSPLLSSSPSIRPVTFPFPKYPSLPPGVENTKDLPPSLSSFKLIMHALSFLHVPILDWANSISNPPVCIISDFFTGWTYHLAHFVWSMRTTGAAAEERACVGEGRGLVIRGWAPQVEILNHRSVGFFLTHCGWNSVLEGIAGGVVMLTWPMGADQHYNARLLEEEVGVGVRVCEGTDAVPDGEELGRVMKELLVGDEGEEKRRKATELREKAAKTVQKGGRSWGEIEDFVETINKFKRKV